jgi:hypothetical protein
MTAYHPKADQRRREAIDRAVDQFDSPLLADMVRDKLYYRHGAIVRLTDAMERCYTLSEDNDEVQTDDMDAACFDAAETIREQLDAEVQAHVQDALDDVVADRAAVIGFHGDDGRNAIDEARERAGMEQTATAEGDD